MKLSLINRSICPPDGFRWVCPNDGFVAQAWTFDAWLDVCKRHLRANNEEVPSTLESDMENQLCQTLPPDWCNFDDPNRPRVSTSLGWGDVMNGLQTFTNWIGSGMSYVSQGEADRRAEICAKCFYNTNVSGCASCQKLVEEVVRNKKSKYDSYLKACAVCKCFLRAKIHFPISTLGNSHGEVYKQVNHCWLNPESENYRG